MAAISRIVSLPSATQYNPTDFPHPSFTYAAGVPFLTAFTWGQVAYGGTPTNTVEWTPPISHNDNYPQYFFKNKETSQYRFKLYRTSDNVVVKDGLLSLYGNVPSPTQEITTDLGSGLIAGTEYLLATYTLANGTTSKLSKDEFGNSWEFRAMTAPETSPTVTYTGYSASGGANSWYGQSLFFPLATHTVNWGGASPYEYDQERYYDVDLIKENGSVGYTSILYLDDEEAIYVGQAENEAAYVTTAPPTDVVGIWPSSSDGSAAVGPEQLKMWIKARTLAGSAPSNQHGFSALTGFYQIFPTAKPYGVSILPTSGHGFGGYSATIEGYFLGSDNLNNIQIGGTYSPNIYYQDYNTVIFQVPDNRTGTSGPKDIILSGPAGSYTMTPKFTYTDSGPYFPPYFGGGGGGGWGGYY